MRSSRAAATMAALYPRTISLSRPNAESETVLATGMRASIQHDQGIGGRPEAKQPAGRFKIFIPRTQAGEGWIRSKDLLVDDRGDRYQVTHSYWSSLGYSLRARAIEA